MQPLAVDLKLLRDVLLPEVRIATGRALMARVVSAENGRGSLSIAGYLLEAELPHHVKAGQELRLEVRDVTAQRVLLGIADTAPQPPPPSSFSLPGGGRLAVVERDSSGEGGGASGEGGRASRSNGYSLSLRYDAPALGAMDLRFDLDAGSLRVGVAVAAGDCFQRAQGEADALRHALAAAVSVTSSVTVSARRDPIDLYA